MPLFRSRPDSPARNAAHPGVPALLDGSAAIVRVERSAGSTAALAGGTGVMARTAALWRQMAAPETPAGAPERAVESADEPAALAAAAGLSESGLRATAFASGAGLVAAHGALYGIAGKRLPLVVHVAAQAAPRSGWSELPGHDTWHAVADAGWFQLFAWDAQSAADLALIARRIAEQALLPGLVAQDAWLTTHRAASLRQPEPALAHAYLGTPQDEIACPTAAQRLLYGERRPRVPAPWSVDSPLLSGTVHGAGSFAEALAAQQAFGWAHLAELAAQAMAAYAELTGRAYGPVMPYRCEDAETLIVAQGSAVTAAQTIADHLRTARRLRVGVVNVAMLRPFPGAALASLLVGKRGVLVLERLLQPGAEDAPLLGELRAALSKAAENGAAPRGEERHPGYPRLRRLEDAPRLVSAACGLGGREPSAGELIAAVESLLPGAAYRPRLLLGTRLQPAAALTPKQEIFAQHLADAYPELVQAAPPAAQSPRLLPEGALVLRVHAAQGREPFTLDDHLGHTLHELSGLHVQAWPEAGRRRRGVANAFTLVASTDTIRCCNEPLEVDVAVVTDPVALRDPALAAALKPQGTLLLALPTPASDAAEPTEPTLPASLRAALQGRGVRVYAFPGQALAQQEARDADAQRKALACLLQGALLACPPVAAMTGLEGSALLRGLKSMLLQRHPHTEASELDAELALYRRGTETLASLALGEQPEVQALAAAAQAAVGTAPELRQRTPHPVPLYDLHRLSEAYPGAQDSAAGAPSADPFLGSGVLPATSALLRDLSGERTVYPHWLPQRCTGCGACWAICPDAALPGLVSTPGELLQTGLRVMEQHGQSTANLPRAVRVLEGKWHDRLLAAGAGASVDETLQAAVVETLPAAKATPDEREALATELAHLREAVQPFPLAVTVPFFGESEAAVRGSGGLLSVTVDPGRCKACGACVQACPEQALELREQTPDSLSHLRRHWSFWLRLPSSGEAFCRLGESRSEAPTLETLLLDKSAYRAMVGGSESDPGAAENTVLHLFAAMAQSAQQPRAAEQVERLRGLIERLEGHARLKLAVDVSDVDALGQAVRATEQGDLTLAALSERLDRDQTPIDTAWLARVTATLAGLKRLLAGYTQGEGGRPRAALGMVAALDAVTAPLAAWPFNPFAFPCSGQPASAAPSALSGIAEGHLARMAEGFRLVRMAELELAGTYNPEVHDAFFARFGWRDLSAQEWALCPPVVLVGDEAALAGNGAGAVLELLRSGKPLKVLCLDAHAYRRLAELPGSAPPFGEADPGTEGDTPPAESLASELALQALAQGTAYVEQGSLGDVPRLLEGFRRGLTSPRPALFAVFRASLPAHGGADALAAQQSRLALQSRAHPWLRFDPDAGAALHERLSLAGNPAPEAPWPVLTQEHLDGSGHAQSHEGLLTFAHFALAVPELAHHFTPLAPDAPGDGLTPLADYLVLDGDERRESRPFIETVDYAGRVGRWLVSQALVQATARRRDLWRLLRALTREDIVPVDEAAIAEQARGEMVETVLRSLMVLAQSDGAGATDALAALAQPAGDAAEQGPRHG